AMIGGGRSRAASDQSDILRWSIGPPHPTRRIGGRAGSRESPWPVSCHVPSPPPVPPARVRRQPPGSPVHVAHHGVDGGDGGDGVGVQRVGHHDRETRAVVEAVASPLYSSRI